MYKRIALETVFPNRHV